MGSIEFNNVLVLDIVSIIILLVYVLVNYSRGFARTVISAVGYIVAIVLASIAGDVSAQNLYDTLLKDDITSNVETVLEKNEVIEPISTKIKDVTYGISLSKDKLSVVLQSPDSMYSAINSNDGVEFMSQSDIDELLGEVIDENLGEPLKKVIPTSAVDYMVNAIKSSEETLYGLTSALTQDNKTCAEYLEEHFIQPVVVYIVKIAIFIVVFFIVMIITKVISSTIHNIDVFPGMSVSMDRILGGITGLVEGIVLILLLCIFLKWAISVNVGSEKLFSSEDINDKSLLFKYFYNIDTLKLLTSIK